MALAGIRQLREMLDSFDSELKERGLDRDTYPGVAVAMKDVTTPSSNCSATTSTNVRVSNLSQKRLAFSACTSAEDSRS